MCSRIVLDPAGFGTLSEQLAAVLKRRIALGELKPGDRLPGVRELARICGTSVRVPLAAIDALAKEGLVASRPRIGAVVLGKRRKLWRGRVLMLRNCVCADYTGLTLREEISNTLSRANWRVEFVTVPHTRDRRHPDMSGVERDLAETVDFVILCFGSEMAAQAIEKRGIPYATLDGLLPLRRNQVANAVWTYGRAVADFAADCKRKGIKNVFAVGFDMMPNMGIETAMEDAGVALETMVVNPCWSSERLESFRECGYKAIKARLASGRMPDLVFFADDYLAVGGLWAIAEAGLRIPDDIKVVTVACRNNRPFYPKPLTRIEWDLGAIGAKFSRAILKFLEDGARSGNMFFSPRYVCGETF